MGDDNIGHLERLVSELGAHGLLARVVRTQTGRLFVRVINPNATSLSDPATYYTADLYQSATKS